MLNHCHCHERIKVQVWCHENRTLRKDSFHPQGVLRRRNIEGLVKHAIQPTLSAFGCGILVENTNAKSVVPKLAIVKPWN